MNLPMTSKEELIANCREMVREKGLSSINMRSVAAKCQVSVGAVYNYFPSKTELLCATIESIWKDIFHMSKNSFEFTDFLSCISWLFKSIQQGCEKYPEFLSGHAISFASENKVMGQKLMQNYFTHLKYNLMEVLKGDKQIRTDAFNEVLTQSVFIEYIFDLFITSIAKGRYDYKGILELVKRFLYE